MNPPITPEPVAFIVVAVMLPSCTVPATSANEAVTVGAQPFALVATEAV